MKNPIQPLVKERSVAYPNIILIFSLFYFSYIVEQESENILRKYLYIILLLSVAILLLYINSDNYILKRIKQTMWQLYYKYFKKIEYRERPDDIKEFIE
jgi:hypothetical protein